MLAGWGRCSFVNQPVRCRYFAAVGFFPAGNEAAGRIN